MADKNPLVSICIPVYNGGDLLHRALQSSLRQTYRHIEVVVSDNASTDDTAAVVAAYVARDARVRYFRNDTNIGSPRNFLRSFELARGVYAQLLGHDDWLSSNYVEESIKNFKLFPETAAVLPRTISFSIDKNGDMQFISDVIFKPGNYPQAYVAKHIYRTLLGCLMMYGMVRRCDLIEATRFAIRSLENLPNSVPQRFREFGKKGYGLDVMITPKILKKYPYLTVTDQSALMKISNPANSSAAAQQEGLGKGSIVANFTSYGFLRACSELVYATDFKNHLRAMRIFLGKEALVTVVFDFIKSGFPRGFFRGWKKVLKEFFETYSVSEKTMVFVGFLPLLIQRSGSFLMRALKRKRTIEKYREYLTV